MVSEKNFSKGTCKLTQRLQAHELAMRSALAWQQHDLAQTSMARSAA